MDKRSWISGYRVVFALLTLVAIGYQIYDIADDGDFKPANFFSFFTIQSNLLAVAALLLGAFVWNARATVSPTIDLFRGLVAFCMMVTGVVYGLLLSGYQEELQTTVPWVDTVLHRVMPIVILVDWMLDPPRRRLNLREAMVWLAYPVVYFVYSLIRGPLVDWYPYPFLNPDEAGGYLGVAAYAVGIAVGALIFVWLIVTIGNRVRLTLAPQP